MPQVTVNYLAVLIAALINIFLGMLWYSPAMFAKAWLASIGKTPEEISGSSAGVYYVINTVASLILAYVLAMFIRFAGANTAVLGAQTGIWVWLGFVVTTLLPGYMFEKRSFKTYFIFIGYQLISFILMGIVLAIWV
jgi:hypothetical protein